MFLFVPFLQFLLVLCDTWNWRHDNNTILGIEYRDTITLQEVHMKR